MTRLKSLAVVVVVAVFALLSGLLNFHKWTVFEEKVDQSRRDNFIRIMGDHCETEDPILIETCRVLLSLRGPNKIQDEHSILKSETERLKISSSKLPDYLAQKYCVDSMGICHLTGSALSDVRLARQIQKGAIFTPATTGAKPSRFNKEFWRYTSLISLVVLALALWSLWTKK
jgi:hypothetical protein